MSKARPQTDSRRIIRDDTTPFRRSNNRKSSRGRNNQYVDGKVIKHTNY